MVYIPPPMGVERGAKKMSKSTVLFDIAGFPVHLFGIMIALGILAGLYVTVKHAEKYNLNGDKIYDLVLQLLVGGVIGARILYILLNLGYYLSSPLSVFSIHRGGLAFHGAVLAGVLIVWRFAKKNNMSFLAMADFLAPGLILGYAVGRIGCDIFGNVTSVPWAIDVYGLPRHPVQLYSAVSGFGIFAILMWVRKCANFQGQVFTHFIGLYSSYRFFIEFFRNSGSGITTAQIVSAVLVIAYFVVLGSRHFLSARTT